MSQPIITLPDSAKALGISDTLTLTDEGQALMLRLGKHEELHSATLILQGSGDEQTLASMNTTDHGPVEDNIWPSENVNWLMADWAEERSLVSVHVEGTAGNIRAKVFVNGGWAPLSPGDIITIGSEQHFPAVVCSKLMLEPVDNGSEYGLFSPQATSITGLTLKCTKQPINVSLCIDELPPFFQQAGALPAGLGVPVDDFTAAVNDYLAAGGNHSSIPLRVQATTSGEFFINHFSARAALVATALEDTAADNSIFLPWGGEASGRIIVGAKKQIREVQFRQRSELVDERLYWPMITPTSHQALLCDPEHALAQTYTALPEGDVLQGLDFYLRPGNTSGTAEQTIISGTLTLHPDDKGKPAEQAFPGAEFKFNLPVDQNTLAKAYWQSFDVSAAQLSKGPWWAVITVDSGGELFCYTDVATSMSEFVSGVLYHVAGSDWLSAQKADSPETWILSRLRLSDKQSKTIEFALRRGGTLLPVSADDDGQVTLSDPAVLARLNKGTAVNRKALEIVVTSDKTAEVSGTVKMSGLRVVSV